MLEPETLDRIPADTAYSIERAYFPSLIENGETFVAHIYRGLLDRHRHARKVPPGAPRHHERPVRRAAIRGQRRAPRVISPRPASRTAPRSRRRASSTPASSSRPARASAPTRVIGHHSTHRRATPSSTARFSGRTRGSTPRRSIGAALAGRHCHFGRNVEIGDDAIFGDKSQVTDYSKREARGSGLGTRGQHNDHLTRDLQGVRRPRRSTRPRFTRPPRVTSAARSSRISAAGASASRATCGCRRRRSPRRSSRARGRRARTSSTTACAPPTCSTSASSATGSTAARRSRRRTTRSNTTAIKMVRKEAFPLSGDAGIGEIRDMVTEGRLPAPRGHAGRSRDARAARRLRREGHVASSIRRRSSHFNVVLDAGSGMARPRRAAALRSAALPDDAALLRDRRHGSRTTKPIRSSKRTGATSSSGSIAERRRHRHRLGRRRRPLLLHRRQRRVHRRRLRHGAAGGSGAAQVAGREHRLRRARELRGQGHRRADTAAPRS